MDAQAPTTGTPKQRQCVGLPLYEETLNIVMNTLHIDENEAIRRAGYSTGAFNHWRRAGKVPLVAINALRGLLLGHEMSKAPKQPLALSIDELLTLANECRNQPLRAALYREIARRVDPKGK